MQHAIGMFGVIGWLCRTAICSYPFLPILCWDAKQAARCAGIHDSRQQCVWQQQQLLQNYCEPLNLIYIYMICLVDERPMGYIMNDAASLMYGHAA